MKKFTVLVSLGFLSLNLAFADYKLMIKKGDGVQSEQCIKSYTFSNNLENIARQNGLGKDVYSEQETLTNKVYLGKPVYRKVIKLNDFNVLKGQRIVKYSDVISNEIEEIVKFNYSYYNNGAFYDTYNDYVIYEPGKYTFTGARYLINDKKATVEIVQKHPSYNGSFYITNFKFFIEYTKTTDLADDSLDSFKSYIHYVPSNSEDKEIITEEITNAGVQVLENHVYDKDSESCTKK